jgi:hypothetical protein
MEYDDSHSLQVVRLLMDLNKALAKASIEMQKVTYTSALRYNANSRTYYREFDPSELKYVGARTPEIDKAWAELLAGTSSRLSS